MRCFFLLSLSLIFFACQASHQEVNKTPKIIVSIAPEKYLIDKIAEQTVKVEVLVPSGASPHTYEPSAHKIFALSEADAWFLIGESFEIRALEVLSSQNTHLKVIDLRDHIDLLPLCCHCHADVHLDKNAHDSHIWLSPRLLNTQAALICRTLIELYPEHQELYKKNLAVLSDELSQLDLEIAQLFENSPRHTVLVSHPAFAYFCRDYHLSQLSIEVEGKEPTAKQLTHLLNEAREHDIQTVFIQEQYSTKGAELVANELEAQMLTIDPYAENIVENLRKIALAFSQ